MESYCVVYQNIHRSQAAPHLFFHSLYRFRVAHIRLRGKRLHTIVLFQFSAQPLCRFFLGMVANSNICAAFRQPAADRATQLACSAGDQGILPRKVQDFHHTHLFDIHSD